jgi:hypothetical protein
VFLNSQFIELTTQMLVNHWMSDHHNDVADQTKICAVLGHHLQGVNFLSHRGSMSTVSY